MERPTIKHLKIALKKQADAILDSPPKKFNLKRLITEENLKKVGILSDRVGTICPFKTFKHGVAEDSSDEEDLEAQEDADNIDEGILGAPTFLARLLCLYIFLHYVHCFCLVSHAYALMSFKACLARSLHMYILIQKLIIFSLDFL